MFFHGFLRALGLPKDISKDPSGSHPLLRLASLPDDLGNLSQLRDLNLNANVPRGGDLRLVEVWCLLGWFWGGKSRTPWLPKSL